MAYFPLPLRVRGVHSVSRQETSIMVLFRKSVSRSGIKDTFQGFPLLSINQTGRISFSTVTICITVYRKPNGPILFQRRKW